MVKIGLAKEIITPMRGLSLSGYFGRRPNRGSLDDAYIRAIVFELNGVRTGILSYDICSLTPDFYKVILAKLPEYGVDFGQDIIFTATHSHTMVRPPDDAEPELTKLFVEEVALKSALAARRAMYDLGPGSLEFASERNNPYAHVRRYFMKNGSVVTNPGKYNPNIVGPESTFDNTISVIAVKKEGRLAAVLTNIANHGDSTGGDLVSADWQGRMEHYIQHKLGDALPVFALMDASGDINQVNNFDDVNPCSPAEATRLGQGYARIVLDLLSRVKPLDFEEISVRNSNVTMPHRRIPEAELEKARKILEEIPEMKDCPTFTSEDLANGHPQALRHFAKAKLSTVGSDPSHDVKVTVIALGKELAFVALPGEPFNGIAQAIRAKSPYKHTIIVELSQGTRGYIPMPECFARGGYETSPSKNSPAENTATVLIEGVLKIM